MAAVIFLGRIELGCGPRPVVHEEQRVVAEALGAARYAGPAADDASNNSLLLRELATVAADRRTARYRCAMTGEGSSGQRRNTIAQR
jgi:hypothetical protein